MHAGLGKDRGKLRFKPTTHVGIYRVEIPMDPADCLEGILIMHVTINRGQLILNRRYLCASMISRQTSLFPTKSELTNQVQMNFDNSLTSKVISSLQIGPCKDYCDEGGTFSCHAPVKS